jgi:hypothetical protein
MGLAVIAGHQQFRNWATVSFPRRTLLHGVIYISSIVREIWQGVVVVVIIIIIIIIIIMGPG